MAHLIRSISGTNREPIYGPWRNCETCAEIEPAETAALEKLLADTPQELGMTLEQFWSAAAAEIMADALHPRD